LEGLKIENTSIVGNSFGGFLALNSALSLPEKVSKVVLISPAATFVPIPAWTLHFMPVIAFGLLTHSKKTLLYPYNWIWQDFPKDEYMAQLRAVSAFYGRPRHWNPTVISDDELRKIKAPVLLLIGDHEVIYKPEAAIKRAKRLVPNLKAEIVLNANHIAEYTACEAINQFIMDFLAQ
jgi:pimeloyl-ACP methyl ester carboxylesterase